MKDEAGFEALIDAAREAAPAADRIFLRDHVREIEIGCYTEEFGVTQRVSFSVVLDVEPFSIGHDDEVESVVSYDLIVEAIEALATGPRIKLLETFAERLAARLLGIERVQAALIRIEKIDRVAGALGIEIQRRR